MDPVEEKFEIQNFASGPEVFDQPSYYQLLKDSAPWSKFRT
jgi:hypothetical protein